MRLQRSKHGGWFCLLACALYLQASLCHASLGFTVTTTDGPNGGTTTDITNFGLSIKAAADGSVLSKNYGNGALRESRTYNAEGLLASFGTGPEAMTQAFGNDGLSRTLSGGGGYSVTETFYNVGLRKTVSGGGETRRFTWQRGMLASEKHEGGPWERLGPKRKRGVQAHPRVADTL